MQRSQMLSCFNSNQTTTTKGAPKYKDRNESWWMAMDQIYFWPENTLQDCLFTFKTLAKSQFPLFTHQPKLNLFVITKEIKFLVKVQCQEVFLKYSPIRLIHLTRSRTEGDEQLAALIILNMRRNVNGTWNFS